MSPHAIRGAPQYMMAAHAVPLRPPCAVVASAETTVRLGRAMGTGGRNHKFCIAAARVIAGLENVAIASVGTDGKDGTSDAAGAIIDGHTYMRMERCGLNPSRILAQHNSGYAFKMLRDSVRLGPTGTNVMDLIVAVVV